MQFDYLDQPQYNEDQDRSLVIRTNQNLEGIFRALGPVVHNIQKLVIRISHYSQFRIGLLSSLLMLFIRTVTTQVYPSPCFASVKHLSIILDHLYGLPFRDDLFYYFINLESLYISCPPPFPSTGLSPPPHPVLDLQNAIQRKRTMTKQALYQLEQSELAVRRYERALQDYNHYRSQAHLSWHWPTLMDVHKDKAAVSHFKRSRASQLRHIDLQGCAYDPKLELPVLGFPHLQSLTLESCRWRRGFYELLRLSPNLQHLCVRDSVEDQDEVNSEKEALAARAIATGELARTASRQATWQTGTQYESYTHASGMASSLAAAATGSLNAGAETLPSKSPQRSMQQAEGSTGDVSDNHQAASGILPVQAPPSDDEPLYIESWMSESSETSEENEDDDVQSLGGQSDAESVEGDAEWLLEEYYPSDIQLPGRLGEYIDSVQTCEHHYDPNHRIYRITLGIFDHEAEQASPRFVSFFSRYMWKDLLMRRSAFRHQSIALYRSTHAKPNRPFPCLAALPPLAPSITLDRLLTLHVEGVRTPPFWTTAALMDGNGMHSTNLPLPPLCMPNLDKITILGGRELNEVIERPFPSFVGSGCPELAAEAASRAVRLPEDWSTADCTYALLNALPLPGEGDDQTFQEEHCGEQEYEFCLGKPEKVPVARTLYRRRLGWASRGDFPTSWFLDILEAGGQIIPLPRAPMALTALTCISTKTTHLDLSGSTIVDELFMEAMRFLTHLSHLSLRNVRTLHSNALCRILPKHCLRLATLDITGSSVSLDGVALLVAHMRIASDGLFGLREIWADDPDLKVWPNMSPRDQQAEQRAFQYLSFLDLIVDVERQRWLFAQRTGALYSKKAQKKRLQVVFR